MELQENKGLFPIEIRSMMHHVTQYGVNRRVWQKIRSSSMNFRNINLGNRPLTIGIIFGIILAVVLVLYSFIAPFIEQTLGALGLFVDIAIYFVFGLVAGRRASTLTEKISSGVVAGAIEGLVSSLLAGI